MASESANPNTVSKPERLISLDALRGFDMFWIIGGESIAHAAAKLTGWVGLVWLSEQLVHPNWHGFTFYDLIFPLFLFMAGVSMPYSFQNRLARGDSQAKLYRHIIVRGLLLVILGWVYNGILDFDFQNMRYPSVLGRIGLAYLFAGLIFCNTEFRGRLLWIAGILVSYWAALKFIPVPEYGAGDLEPGHTLTDWIDRNLIPGRLYKEVRDPEGILSTVPAIATALAGGMTGQFLKHSKGNGYFKTVVMGLVGLLCLGLAWIWNHEFPINKNLWSSSFMLHCAGWSLIFLATFYLVIDVWKFRRCAFFFVVIGSNSILIYMAQRMIDFRYTAHFLLDGILELTGDYQRLFWAIGIVTLKWLFLYLMYRKKIFLRV